VEPSQPVFGRRPQTLSAHVTRSAFILRRVKDDSPRYTLSSSGEAPQIACASYLGALLRAERFARSHVDVWQTDDGRVFRRLVEYRGIGTA
jgi:hypothetical protein